MRENEELTLESMAIMDLSGREVRRLAGDIRELDISGLNKGIYILRISTGDKVIARR